jgi:hypothetical protein
MNSQATHSNSAKAWISANAFDHYLNERDDFLRCTSLGTKYTTQGADARVWNRNIRNRQSKKFSDATDEKIMVNASGIHMDPHWNTFKTGAQKQILLIIVKYVTDLSP